MALIEVESLSKTYRSGEILVKALDAVSTSIEPGEFTAIVGPSGSGKSTLMHLIGGLDQPSHGQIRLDGRAIGTMSDAELSDFRRDNIGFVFQSYNLIPVLSAAENVEYIMLIQKVPKPERQRRTLEILKKVGLEGLENRRPFQLSGGQQQRVAVARAMASAPRLILADEPTANLDSATGSALLDLMRDLNQSEGMTFVFSTHDQKIMDRARRLIELKDGRIERDERR